MNSCPAQRDIEKDILPCWLAFFRYTIYCVPEKKRMPWGDGRLSGGEPAALFLQPVMLRCPAFRGVFSKRKAQAIDPLIVEIE